MHSGAREDGYSVRLRCFRASRTTSPGRRIAVAIAVAPAATAVAVAGNPSPVVPTVPLR